MRCFFARDPAAREETPYRAERDFGAVIGQKRLQLSQRGVGGHLVSVQDQPGRPPAIAATTLS